MSKEQPTLDDEAQAIFMMHGAAMAFALEDGRDPRIRDMTIRLIPFVEALVAVGLQHRDELERAWAKAKSEPGPFGLRFDQEESENV